MAKHTQKKVPKTPKAQQKTPAASARKAAPTSTDPWLVTGADLRTGEEMILGLLDLVAALDEDVQMVSSLLGVDLRTRLQAYRDWPTEHKTQWYVHLDTSQWGGEWGAEVQLSSFGNPRKKDCPCAVCAAAAAH